MESSVGWKFTKPPPPPGHSATWLAADRVTTYDSRSGRRKEGRKEGSGFGSRRGLRVARSIHHWRHKYAPPPPPPLAAATDDQFHQALNSIQTRSALLQSMANRRSVRRARRSAPAKKVAGPRRSKHDRQNTECNRVMKWRELNLPSWAMG